MKRLIVLATGAARGARRHGRAGEPRGRASGRGRLRRLRPAGSCSASRFDSLGALDLERQHGPQRPVTKEPSLSATYKALPDSAKGKAGRRSGATFPSGST